MWFLSKFFIQRMEFMWCLLKKSNKHGRQRTTRTRIKTTQIAIGNSVTKTNAEVLWTFSRASLNWEAGENPALEKERQ